MFEYNFFNGSQLRASESQKDLENLSILTNTFRNFRSKWRDLHENDCIYRFLALNYIMACFIILPYFTNVTNVVTEFGISKNQIAILWTACTFIDVLTRPIWGMATRKFSVVTLLG